MMWRSMYISSYVSTFLSIMVTLRHIARFLLDTKYLGFTLQVYEPNLLSTYY
jgi:hypothetical protein